MARQMGFSLASFGSDQKGQAIQELGRASDEESKRNMRNQQLEQQEKAGRVQLGSTVGSAAGMAIGAQYGTAGGPWGALIGGAVGALAGGLWD